MEQKLIMIVDDTEMNISILVEALGNTYDLIIAINGKDALELLEDQKPDLVLLDIMMPEVDGYQVMEAMQRKDDTKDIPVIFLSAMSESDSKTKGFALGAVDYITKPFEMSEVMARVETHLELKDAREWLKNQNAVLETKVRERTDMVEKSKSALIYCLAGLAETRDPETGEHIKRTQNYVRVLARQLRAMGLYEDVLTDDFIHLLYETAPLHDIGKVGVKDDILLKPGKLTADEFKEMKNHTVYGHDTLEKGLRELGKDSFLRVAKEIAYTHHEKWDGSGYPLGLSGVDIPLSGRLMALGDVYDALISKRIYKDALSHLKARTIIIEGKGSHFDPDVVDAFLACEDMFVKIKDEYKE